MNEVAATGGFVRRRRTLRGDGMVTPIEPITVTHPDGRTERLEPGRSRLSPTHEWVKARPDLYIAAYSRDTATRDRLRDAVRARSRTRRTGTRNPAAAPPRGRAGGRVLPDRPKATSFRLP